MLNGTEGDHIRMKGTLPLAVDNDHNCVPSSEREAEGHFLLLSFKRGCAEKNMLRELLPGTPKTVITGKDWKPDNKHTAAGQKTHCDMMNNYLVN